MNRILIAILVCFSLAGEAKQSEVQAKEPGELRQALSKFLPGANIDSIRESEIPGLYEITIGPQIFYVSKDGQYLIRGHLIDLPNRSDLTEARLGQARIKALDQVGENQMIIFSPDKTEHTVSVFTDIDCGYCRRFHSQIDDYLKKGIRVRYLFFPRAGLGSDSFDKAVAVWCAKDRHESLTEAKQGKEVELKKCDNPVEQQYKLGAALGVTGTPTIITDRGEILPGYVPPENLARYLEKAASSQAQK